jgi:hypothetical protein
VIAAALATGWICLLIGVFAGIHWHARRLAQAALLTRRFIGELLAVAIAFSLILWGLPLAGLAIGVSP